MCDLDGDSFGGPARIVPPIPPTITLSRSIANSKLAERPSGQCRKTQIGFVREALRNCGEIWSAVGGFSISNHWAAMDELMRMIFDNVCYQGDLSSYSYVSIEVSTANLRKYSRHDAPETLFLLPSPILILHTLPLSLSSLAVYSSAPIPTKNPPTNSKSETESPKHFYLLFQSGVQKTSNPRSFMRKMRIAGVGLAWDIFSVHDRLSFSNQTITYNSFDFRITATGYGSSFHSVSHW